MKLFTDIDGFKQALKIGSKIKIVEHNILPVKDKDQQDTNDTLFDDGIICEINHDCFGVNINGTEYWFTLVATQEPFQGSVHFFATKYPTNRFYIYEHTITFKCATNPNIAYSFVLLSDEKSHCPHCKGSGVQAITCETFGYPEKSISFHACYYCKGEIVNEVEGKHIQDVKDYEASLWCKCSKKRNYDVYYMADGEDKEIRKHHWRCCKCNKVRQIG